MCEEINRYTCLGCGKTLDDDEATHCMICLGTYCEDCLSQTAELEHCECCRSDAEEDVLEARQQAQGEQDLSAEYDEGIRKDLR